jgi:GPH family glycoside/pentoside/hexuronide:cation symporter
MSQSPPYTTRPSDRISFREKTALGAGFLPVFFGYAAVNSFAIPVYQMTLHLDPELLALVLVIPRFWDAITDPAMGLISDNTQSRFGRRRPYIVVGALVQALAFGAIWMAPASWGQTGILVYLLTTLFIFYSCFTVYSVPLASLTYEMTPDPQERTRVAAFAGFFHKSGEFLYQWIFPLTGLAIFASKMQGVQVIGWCVAVLVFAGLGVLPGLFVKERYFQRAAKQEKVKFLPSLRASLRNRAFVVLLGLTVLQIVAGMFASNIDYYVIVYHMNGGDVAHGSIWKGILSSAYAVVGIAMIYPVNWLAHRIGKR